MHHWHGLEHIRSETSINSLISDLEPINRSSIISIFCISSMPRQAKNMCINIRRQSLQSFLAKFRRANQKTLHYSVFQCSSKICHQGTLLEKKDFLQEVLPYRTRSLWHFLVFPSIDVYNALSFVWKTGTNVKDPQLERFSCWVILAGFPRNSGFSTLCSSDVLQSILCVDGRKRKPPTQ